MSESVVIERKLSSQTQDISVSYGPVHVLTVRTFISWVNIWAITLWW